MTRIGYDIFGHWYIACYPIKTQELQYTIARF